MDVSTKYNFTSSDVNYSDSGSTGYSQAVSGSTMAAPPTWDSRFATLESIADQYSWSYSTDVPAQTKLDFLLNFTEATGSQVFDDWENGVDTGNSISRNLDIYTPNGSPTQKFTSLVGGGQGGG